MSEPEFLTINASSTQLPAKRSLWAALKANWGMLTGTRKEDFVVFSEAEISAWARRTPAPAAALDEQTWRDLHLSALHRKIAANTSIVGQQSLYARMRNTATDNEVADLRVQLKNMPERLRSMLAPLKQTPFDLSGFLHDELPCLPLRLAKYLPHYQLLLCLAFAAPLLSLSMLVPLALLVLLSFMLQLYWSTQTEGFETKLQALLRTLDVAIAVARDHHGLPAAAAHLAEDSDALQALRRNLARSPLEATLPLTKLYSDWFFLNGLRHYAKARALLQMQRPVLHRTYEGLGRLEADLALTEHLQSHLHYSWAKRRTDHAMRLTGFINPLLDHCVPLSFDTNGQSILLSGQNGAGKSTFLRTLGINLAMGRAFGFCYAKQASIPLAALYTSIHIEDSLEAGHSLYIAELNRAKQMLFNCQSEPLSICLIDEIFRGTNHLESVSVSVSVIHALAKSALVIVSSHNLILAPLLRTTTLPMLLKSDADGITVEPGLLRKTNGISLLDKTGFSSQIKSNADVVAAWLGPYLAFPAECNVDLR